MSGHEGASVWTRETATKYARLLRIAFSRAITPSTADLMAMVQEKGTWVVNYGEVKARLTEQLARPVHCPANHPVFPIELRVWMAPRYGKLVLKLFPNLDGFPTRYLPVRAYFCPVCQELYRQREIDEAMMPVVHDGEEVVHASAR